MNPPSTSPQIIDSRYQVVRLLGQGGMGAVYECRHVGTRRSFAVKVILAEAMGKPQALDRFLREAAAAGSIKSPFVVDVTDVGLDRVTSSAFMAMELLEGHDLAKQIEERGKQPPDLVLRLAAQALQGLSAAHAAGVVHRDMKPANLFLAKTGGGERTVKLLDFGIAKVQAEGDIQHAKLTRTGVIFGSPSYMSPEQASGAAHIDLRTDIWSFGAVMYEALTGAPPYSDSASLQDLIRRIWAGPPPPVSMFAPEVPAEVVAIVSRAMTYDAAGRYQTAEEMLEGVRKLLPGAPTITDAMLGEAESSTGAGSAVAALSGSEPSRVSGSTAPVTPAVIAPLAGSAALGSQLSGGSDVSGGTRPMPAASGAVTGTAFGGTIERSRGRRTLVYAGVTVAVTVALSALALRLVPKPVEPASDAGSAGAPDASGAGTTTAPGITATSPEPVGAGDPVDAGQPADAGPPPDASAGQVQSAPPAGSVKAPSKVPASGASSKPKSAFSSGQRGI